MGKLVTLVKGKRWALPIIGAVVLALTAGGVLAATGSFQTVQHQATGVAAPPPPPPPPPPASYSFELFEADGVTALAQPVAWGNVQVGTPATKTITVKNTGNQTYGVIVDTALVPAGWTLAASPVSGLAPGGSATLTLTLSTTATGAVTFDTEIRAEF